MVKRIIWSANAQLDRKEIFIYWNKTNRSNACSINLNRLFIDASEILSSHPYTRRQSAIDDVRVKIIRDYIMVYRYSETEI